MRTTLIKRCQGLPGDRLEIIDGKVRINGSPVADPPESKTSYTVTTNGIDINPKILHELKVDLLQHIDGSTYVVNVPGETVATLKSFPWVKKVDRLVAARGAFDVAVFPHDKNFKWNEDNYGPLVLPKKGMRITLTDSTWALYRRAIEWYEKNQVVRRGNQFVVNGRPSAEYVFKMNYYWMMGDNRHNSLDSRFWGYVPEDHVIGKAMITWFSMDPNANLLSTVRWNRILKSID